LNFSRWIFASRNWPLVFAGSAMRSMISWWSARGSSIRRCGLLIRWLLILIGHKFNSSQKALPWFNAMMLAAGHAFELMTFRLAGLFQFRAQR
jgi:hypothetical protein